MVDRGEAFGPLAVGGVLRPDRCTGCWIALPRGRGLESELLPERRGVIFEEAASAGAGAAVCCSSGAALGVWRVGSQPIGIRIPRRDHSSSTLL